MMSSQSFVLFLIPAALVVHVAVMVATFLTTGSLDGRAFSSLDSGEYYALARNLVEHGVFSQSAVPPLAADTWRTPGYPLFLALLMLLVGSAPVGLVIAQQVLAVLNVWLAFHVMRPMLGVRRAAVAATIVMLEPYGVYYSLWLMSETLFVTVLLLGWHAWRLASESRRPWHFAVAGALTGCMVLVRPAGALVPVLLVMGWLLIALWERFRDVPARRGPGLSAMLAFSLACLLPLGAWMMRNSVVAGQFSLSHQGGIVLAYFKATEVVLWREGRTAARYLETSLDPARRGDPHVVWASIDARLKEKLSHLSEDERAALRWPDLAQGNRTTVDSFVISRALRELAVEEMRGSPWSTLSCGVWRMVAQLTFPLDLAIRPPEGVTVSRTRSAVLGGLYALLALAAMVQFFRHRPGGMGVLFAWMALLGLLLAATPQIDPRFRVPMIPLLAYLACLPRRPASSEGAVLRGGDEADEL